MKRPFRWLAAVNPNRNLNIYFIIIISSSSHGHAESRQEKTMIMTMRHTTTLQLLVYHNALGSDMYLKMTLPEISTAWTPSESS